MLASNGTLRERIKRHTWRKNTVRVCWPWLGHIDRWGNAKIWIDKKTGSITVQRALYLLEYGAVPEGYEVLSCPLLKDCANPHHIGIGTKEDIAERILWRKRKVRKKPRIRRLSDEQVRQIYLSKKSSTKLAEEYDISISHISNIRAGRKYKHLTQFERETYVES